MDEGPTLCPYLERVVDEETRDDVQRVAARRRPHDPDQTDGHEEGRRRGPVGGGSRPPPFILAGTTPSLLPAAAETCTHEGGGMWHERHGCMKDARGTPNQVAYDLPQPMAI